MRRISFFTAAALVLALFAFGFALAEEAESIYVENEWGYVENSMDISGGIPADATEGLARIQRAGVLRVATEPYFAPQEFIDPSLSGQDSYVGADMELARLIAERMGVELEIVPMEFSQVLDAVADGDCDLAISGLAFTPGRAGMVELSKGYHFTDDNVGSALVVRSEDAEGISSANDLAGKDIIAQSGSLQEALMVENVMNYREFRRVASMQDVYEAVRDGRAFAAIANVENALSYMEHNPDCDLSLVETIQFKQEPQYDGDRIAAKKDEIQLMYFVNGVIDEVLASGQYEAWFAEYDARAKALGL